MRLVPYLQVDEVPMHLGPDDLRARLVAPRHVERNDVGLHAWDYGDRVFRFQDCGRLEEVTRRAPVLHVDRLAIPFPALGAFVARHDPGAFERAGFVVSPRFGVAFVPRDPDWVTALAAHCLDTWRAL